MDSDEETEIREAAYVEGTRAGLRRMLSFVLRELGQDDTSELAVAQLTKQLEDTRAALRRVCADHGDNDWPDNLYLADVVEKHLARHLDEEDETP